MAKGYVIGQIEINDLEAYKKYPGKAQETVEQYGGRYMWNRKDESVCM